MPFIPHTPESLIPRSDSKNPATTCKGITERGRPCRRGLKPRTKSGVLALAAIQSGDGQETDAAAFFCWQHKDQAEKLVRSTSGANRPNDGTTTIVPLQQRTSLDTLYERLGVLEEEGSPRQDIENQSCAKSRPNRRPNRPPTWENVEGPIMTVPRRTFSQQQTSTSVPKSASQRRPKKAKSSFFELFCCGAVPEDDNYIEVIRHTKRKEQGLNYVQRPATVHPLTPRRESLSRPSDTTTTSVNRRSRPPQPEVASESDLARPIAPHQSSSHTSNLLSAIPKHLPPQVTSLLLTELSKPISSFDEEGYIYVFQLTSQESPSTPSKAAKLLTTETSPHSRSRRPSTGMRIPSDVSTNSNRSTSGKLLLKIGRASNVQRRMNEWTRQCNYALELVRWYPYMSSSSASASPSPSPAPSPSSRRSHGPSSPLRPNAMAANGRRDSGSPLVKKIPHSHRVERLIHIELADKRVKRACEMCGKEHREWFEIEAGRDAVKAVDEVVRRWVEWDERVTTAAGE